VLFRSSDGSSKVGYWFHLKGMRWLSRSNNTPVIRVEFEISWEGLSW